MALFEKFGEFDSAAELNMAAEGFKNEGDQDSLFKLAEENGIEKEDADDFMNGDIQEFATVISAAFGRIDVQEKEDIESKTGEMKRIALQIIMTMLRGMCTEEVIAAAVMKKGKRIADIYKIMKKEAEKNKKDGMGISCGTDRDLVEIIRIYYTQSEADVKKKLETMYE